MKVINVVSNWGPQSGGPFINVANISANLILKGHESLIITVSKNPEGYEEAYQWKIGLKNVNIPICISKCYEKLWCFSREFKKKFIDYADKYNVVLIHGLWRFPTTYAAYFCRKHNVPYVVFTHAMMSQWSLSQRRIRKDIYFQLVEKNNLNKANALFVMDNEEMGSADKKGINAKKYCFFNALNREDIISFQEIHDVKQKTLSNGIRLLYLGRIHPKKGLIFLIEAMKEIVKTNPCVKLIIGGPAEDQGYLKRIKYLIKRNKLEQYVSFTGLINGEQKKKAFLEADIFILPSSDDSAPLALLEAMSHGLPVITTPGCKMPEIDNRFGYVVNQSPNEIAIAVNRLIEDEERAQKMGLDGQQYILNNFTWDKRIDELIKIIESII